MEVKNSNTAKSFLRERERGGCLSNICDLILCPLFGCLWCIVQGPIVQPQWIHCRSHALLVAAQLTLGWVYHSVQTKEEVGIRGKSHKSLEQTTFWSQNHCWIEWWQGTNTFNVIGNIQTNEQTTHIYQILEGRRGCHEVGPHGDLFQFWVPKRPHFLYFRLKNAVTVKASTINY